MTNQKAIEGCKRQDRISQKYIFDTWSDGMLMLCMRYVKNLPDAEEIMLNGFFNFYKFIDRFIYSGDSSIGGWLKKIMVNECPQWQIDEVRRIIDKYQNNPEQLINEDIFFAMLEE